MNRKDLSGMLILFSLLLLFPYEAVSQVVVERSKEKVVVSGVSYYIHLVRKGETNYSISRAYNVTEAELIKENPSVVSGPKEGQTLRIPVRPPAAPAAGPAGKATPAVRDESRFLYHKTLPGETIYSVSRKYGVTSMDILSANPGIEVSKLPVGSELAIPKKEQEKAVQAPVQQTPEKKEIVTEQVAGYKPGQKDDAYYHRVANGETLSSIASRFGVKLRDLRRENNNIRFPQVGEYIRIPGMKRPLSAIELQSPDDTLEAGMPDSTMVPDMPTGHTPVDGLEGTVNVAVLLPFYLPENARAFREDTSQTSGRSGQSSRDSWIYPRSLGFVEMYQGILLAADTLRALGLNINIRTYDIKEDTLTVSRLIRSGQLDDADLIIGPAHSSNLSRVASWAGGRDIPVVSPVPLMSNSVLEGKPLLYVARPTLEVAREHIIAEMKQYADHNIILLTDTLGTALPWLKGFRELADHDPADTILFSEPGFRHLIYYSRSDLRRTQGSSLSDLITDKTGNVVILASEDAPMLSEALAEIHSLSRKYDIDVFGYPVLRSLENIDHRYLFELNLKVFSPYWIDYTEDDVRHFTSSFRDKFLTEPSEESYAWTGYDLTYYFISGIALHGKEFLEYPFIHNPDLLHTSFDLRRRWPDGGFENQYMYRVRYSDDYEVKLIENKALDPRLQHEMSDSLRKN
ncbi:MAG: LysM peptidoglycan-binding domain-containing protein [Bacteroidales bacterium]|jgi:LysM repeat protein|nr:LysM peptidoglycan-binding domain-containing protein [Bacteroidales bacterium]